mmetsp:Transcript_24444/g.74591  ORF Transcript_24444/g.74591 Transcript_24444/m.74591 type:complete len:223 (+) Transcript_24444:2475-3143(+)
MTHGHVTEFEDGVVGVVGVADGVGTTKQHLKRHIGHGLAHHLQPLPRALLKEAEADVEGGPAPVLDRVGVVKHVRRLRSNGHDILCADPGGEQRLVRIAPRRVGKEEATPLAHRFGEGKGTAMLEDLLEALRRWARALLGQKRLNLGGGRASCTLDSAPVDGDVAEIVEDLLAAILALRKVEEMGIVTNEGGCGSARLEIGMTEHIGDEGHVGLDAARTRLV